MSSEELEALRSRSAGFTLLDLLDGIGIGQKERLVLVDRVWQSLEAVDELKVASRLLELDVLNDDQVVVIVAMLVQELFASVGYLRPVSVRLRHFTELDRIDPNAKLVENRLQLGGK